MQTHQGQTGQDAGEQQALQGHANQATAVEQTGDTAQPVEAQQEAFENSAVPEAVDEPSTAQTCDWTAWWNDCWLVP